MFVLNKNILLQSLVSDCQSLIITAFLPDYINQTFFYMFIFRHILSNYVWTPSSPATLTTFKYYYFSFFSFSFFRQNKFKFLQGRAKGLAEDIAIKNNSYDTLRP